MSKASIPWGADLLDERAPEVAAVEGAPDLRGERVERLSVMGVAPALVPHSAARARAGGATRPRAWVAVPSRKVATCSVRLRADHGGGRDEPFEKPWLSWPRREEQLTGHGACGVAQEQHDGDDVVERADDGQELGQQVDR